MFKLEQLFSKESILSSISIVFVFYVLQRFVGMARGIVFARVLGPEGYGVYTLAFFAISIIVPLAIVGIPSCYNRYIPQYEKNGMLIDFLKKTYAITIAIGLCTVLFFIYLSDYLSRFIYGTSEQKVVMILCGLTVLPLVLYRNLFSTFSGLRNFKMRSLLEFAQACFFTIFGILLVILYARTAQSAIFANLCSYIFVSIFFGLLLWNYLSNDKKQFLKIHESGFYRKILKFSIWFVLTPLVITIFRYTDRWMLNKFLDLNSVGVYSVAGNITEIIFAVGIIAGNVLAPNLANDWEYGKKTQVIDKINSAIKMIIIFLLGCSILFVLLKRQIIFVLYGYKYLDTIPVINILLLFYLINTVWWIIGIYPTLIEKPYFIFVSAIGGLLINIYLNYKLIPIYGIIGAAAATAIAFSVIVIILFILNKWNKFYLEPKTIFVCLTPFILLLGQGIMTVSYIVLLLIIISTGLLLTKKEKKLLVVKIMNVLKRRIP